MEPLYLSDYYLNAIEREINKRLEDHFLDFQYCLNTTYFNDGRGSFEFKVENTTFKLYTPEDLGDEFYRLHLANSEEPFIEECHNLTYVFNEIEKYLNF